jgi:HEAT repeat protein
MSINRVYGNNELSVLDFEAELDDPLDRIALPEDEEILPPPDADAMLALLINGDTQQRMTAARVFCELQEPRAIPHLIRLLSDDCALLRVSVAYALGRNTSPDAVEPLILRYNQDWNGYVRKGVVWALGNHRDRRSIPTLLEGMRNDISAVRLWAASALAQLASLGYEATIVAIPPLIEGLRRDAVSAVRSNCAWAVGELCRELPSNVIYATAVDALIEAFAEDEDLSVREDAKTAMLKLGDTRGLQVIEELENEGWGL